MKLLAQEKITGTIKVMTGLHIGGIKETFQIGGQDSPVIKLRNGEPYIPGSSLKGKIRSLLERKYRTEGKPEDPCGCGICKICQLFGSHKAVNQRQGCLIFRDATISKSVKFKKNELFETKAENIIDRQTGTAKHPRFIERVVPDTDFEVEIIFNKYEGDDHKKLLNVLKEGFELLANDYLGGSGTRGYGRIDVSSLIQDINSKIGTSEDKATNTG